MYLTKGKYQITVDKDGVRLYRIFETNLVSECYAAKFLSLKDMYDFLHKSFIVKSDAWQLELS